MYVFCTIPSNDHTSLSTTLVIDGNEIDNVQYYAKRLGVTMYNDLTWNRHVEKIVAKAGKREREYANMVW